jgi:hypothetical protein
VNLLAVEANIVDSAIREQEERPYEERRDISKIEAEAAASVRRQFLSPGSIPDDAYLSLDLSGWVGSQAGCNVLSILVHAPEERLALRMFGRLAEVLVRWWDLDDDRQARHERPTAAESTLSDLYRRFVCRISHGEVASLLGPVLAAVDRHPQDVASMVEGLIGLEDRRSDPARFWMIWRLFAERVLVAPWLADIDENPARGEGLTSAMFLGTGWGDGVGHWRSLDGYAHLIHSFFERLPASAAILEDYAAFLYCVGQESLPESFVRLARRLDGPDARWLLRRNTIGVLEALLRRFVYGRPLELKRRSDLRNAVLVILDALVEGGSSAAFRMRDDFVTPDPGDDSRRRPMPAGEGPGTATDPVAAHGLGT